jgi:two-component system cell cycle sensor histidine kinase/response regulator CckA
MTVSAYVSPIYNNRKQHQGYLCHLIDSTEFKNLELRFVHSQKMQAIGQLAGGIAHDFNNLLTAMMGFCDLLLMRHPAGDPSFANIMQVKQNANRAANLIRQLLAFSRKQTLQPKVINITDTLADLSNLIGRLIGENIHLDIIYGKDLGYIKVDQGQLEQVIINLAVNARDAMQKGGTLTIETKNVHITSHQPLGKNLIAPTEEDLHMEDGDYLLIEISDTGEGIEAALLDKIFEPFFSTKEIGSGTGLGLSTVYGIIKQTNGYIFVDSTPGKGTTFHIYLKQYQKVEETETIEQESSQSQDLTGKETILLVEDEAPVRMFSKSALVNKGYTVIEAESGESAIEEIEKHKGKIDMIISDVIMPGMSGPDMIKHISKNYPDIKVIYTSGYTEDAFAKAFGEEHEFNFLPKPYTLKQLASKVKNLLNA